MQFGEELKEVDEDHKKGGQRDWKQVRRHAGRHPGCSSGGGEGGKQAGGLSTFPVPSCPVPCTHPPLPQVFCNALVPTGIALASAAVSGGGPDLALGQAPAGASRLLTALNAAFLGYYACCW